MQHSASVLAFHSCPLAGGCSTAAMVYKYTRYTFNCCPLAGECSTASFKKAACHSWHSEDRFHMFGAASVVVVHSYMLLTHGSRSSYVVDRASFAFVEQKQTTLFVDRA
jgi:hypothetical protein